MSEQLQDPQDPKSLTPHSETMTAWANSLYEHDPEYLEEIVRQMVANQTFPPARPIPTKRLSRKPQQP